MTCNYVAVKTDVRAVDTNSRLC